MSENFKMFLVLLGVLACVNLPQVHGQCEFLVFRYYQCKYANGSSTPLSESFYQSRLNQTSFDEAMGLFRSIYTELDWKTCTSSLCKCVRADAYLDKLNYGEFFLNDNYFNDMSSIVSGVRTKYEKLNEMYSLGNFSETINQYCDQYDYSFETLMRFVETKSCVQLIIDESRGCGWSIDGAWISDYNTQCALSNIAFCDVEIKRLIVLSGLSYVPISVTEGLLSYIDTLVNFSTTTITTTTKAPEYRLFVWSVGDPHFWWVKNGYETCDYKPWGVYINNEKIILNSTTEQAWSPATVTIMTGIYLTFKNGNDTVYYVGDNSSLRKTFENNKTVVYDANNKKWLELEVKKNWFTSYTYNITYSDAIIIDYNSRSIIYLNELNGWYAIFMYTTISTLQSGGMFYDGCPDQFVHNYRRKRATSDATEACANTTSSSYADPSLANLQKACENDVTITGDKSFGAIFNLALNATAELKALEQKTFPTSGSSNMNKIQLSSSIIFTLCLLITIVFKK